MKSERTIPARHQLLDYVTKREFNDFREEFRVFRDEMSDFRELTERRFSDMEKRFNDMDRKFNCLSSQFDQVREDFRVHTGAILDEFRSNSKITLEYIQGLRGQNLNEK